LTKYVIGSIKNDNVSMVWKLEGRAMLQGRLQCFVVTSYLPNSIHEKQ